MSKEISKEKFWKLYNTLPQELKDALFAEETGDNAEEACKKNNAEEHLDGVVDFVGQVLLGIISPADFKDVLEKKLGIDPERARKIDQEIFRTIFYPVKAVLEIVGKATSAPTEVAAEKEYVAPAGVTEEKPSSPQRPDSYREPIE